MSPKTTGHRKHIIYQFVSRKFFLETFENLHNYFVALSNYFKQLTKCWLQYPCCDLCDFLLSFSVICWVVIWGFSHVSDCLFFNFDFYTGTFTYKTKFNTVQSSDKPFNYRIRL